ncbi:MAG: hypothetical protein ACFKPT_17305 [Gloeotrichia echinulata GP01]
MSFNQSKKIIFTVVKYISTVLIVSAIVWELGNIYAAVNHQQIPSNLNFIFWIERFALIAHFLEGIIAALYAPSKRKNPIQYSIYTFFVGTVALWELFNETTQDTPI